MKRVSTMLGFGLLLAASACGPPAVSGVRPEADWPDLGDAPAGLLDARQDRALIVAIEDPALGGRPGAGELAAAWRRYLVETRGLRLGKVKLLRDEKATRAAVTRALAKLESGAGNQSRLWLLFIGSASSPVDGGEGALRLSDGALPFADIREALAHGQHNSAFVLVDGCAEQPGPERRAGLPARFPEQRWPRFQTAPGGAPTSFEGIDLDEARAAGVEVEFEFIDHTHKVFLAESFIRDRDRRRNLFVLSAGTGSRCADRLADRPWPALSYAALAALQGWADQNEDGRVSARELAIYAQAMLGDLDAELAAAKPALVATAPEELAPAAPEGQPRVEAGGTDLILAELVGAGPRAARKARSRRHARALEPGAASQTDAALTLAASRAKLDLEDMVPVPAGSFRRGCARKRDPECEKDERPDRLIELDAYAIDRSEVTWAEYKACIQAGGCPPLRTSLCWVWTGESFERYVDLPEPMLRDDHPAVCVRWTDAANYCQAAGKRLPSEAEWERAARGVDGRIYPWGDEAPTCDHTAMSGCTDFSTPVATHPAGASPVGAQDMAGNVYEWVFDWWDERAYKGAVELANPDGPANGEVRGVRGGSFYSSDFDLRSSYRYGIEPRAALSIIGFRCAR